MQSTHDALEVIKSEIAGLTALSDVIGREGGKLAEAFESAVRLCGAVQGRVIATGMGKSGHIARKIAATLASTGTPASFVHPGEASHGDLGMISRNDIVIALSNSGETPELGDILGYAARFSIPLIGITSGSESSLAKASQVALVVPKAPEACNVTKAPTTSTTQMIALGDALAVAVLRRKGFTEDEFFDFHPGGKLGAALKRVTDLMHHTEMPLCKPGDSISDAIEIMTFAGFGCIGVIDDDGKLVGIVTDGDLRRHFATLAHVKQVSEVMTTAPHIVTMQSLAAEALAILSRHKITAMFIVDDTGQPVGLIHIHDCLDAGVL